MHRKSLFLLIFAAITGFIAFRLWGSDFDWTLFLTSLWNIRPGWLAASIAATFLTYLSRGLRWQILLNPLKSIRLGSLVNTNILGFSAIFVFGRAGEIIRPLWLTRVEQVPLTASVATIVAERFLDTLTIIVFFAWALLIVKLPAAAEGTVEILKNTAWIMLATSAGAILFLFFFHSNIERITRYVRFAKVASHLRTFSQGLSFLQRGRSLGLALSYSAMLWFFISLQFWFMLLGMNINFTIQAATLVMVGAAIGSVAQIPGIGGGFQAGYVFCMTTFFLVPPERAIATSLVAWVLSNIPTVMMAGFYMVSHGLSLKDLRTATATE